VAGASLIRGGTGEELQEVVGIAATLAPRGDTLSCDGTFDMR